MNRFLFLLMSVGFCLTATATVPSQPSTLPFPPLPPRWATVADCRVPILAHPSLDTIGADDVKLEVDLNGGTVKVLENGSCTQVYFRYAWYGISQAQEMGCQSWLNYDVPTFQSGNFNFPARLTPGKDGERARALYYDGEKFYLQAFLTIPAADPEQNTYVAKDLAISCI